MAKLKNLNTEGFVKTATLREVSNQNLSINFDVLDKEARYLRNAIMQINTDGYATSTSWEIVPGFKKIKNFKAGSLIRLNYFFTDRTNVGAHWGGGYIEPQIRINEGEWYSLGSCGHDAGVMQYLRRSRGHYWNVILIDPKQTENFDAQFRFFIKDYNATFYINTGNNVNVVSGTAPPYKDDFHYNQHYCHAFIEEFALWDGDDSLEREEEWTKIWEDDFDSDTSNLYVQNVYNPLSGTEFHVWDPNNSRITSGSHNRMMDARVSPQYLQDGPYDRLFVRVLFNSSSDDDGSGITVKDTEGNNWIFRLADQQTNQMIIFPEDSSTTTSLVVNMDEYFGMYVNRNHVFELLYENGFFTFSVDYIDLIKYEANIQITTFGIHSHAQVTAYYDSLEAWI